MPPMTIRPDSKAQTSIGTISPVARSMDGGKKGAQDFSQLLAQRANSHAELGNPHSRGLPNQALETRAPDRSKPERSRPEPRRPERAQQETRALERSKPDRSRAERSKPDRSRPEPRKSEREQQRTRANRARDDRSQDKTPRSSGHELIGNVHYLGQPAPATQLTAFDPQLSGTRPDQWTALTSSPQQTPFGGAELAVQNQQPNLRLSQGLSKSMGGPFGQPQQQGIQYQVMTASQLQQTDQPLTLGTFAAAHRAFGQPMTQVLGDLGQGLGQTQGLTAAMGFGAPPTFGQMADDALAQIRQLFGAELPSGPMTVAGDQLSSTTEANGIHTTLGEAPDPLTEQIRQMLATAEDTQEGQLSSTDPKGQVQGQNQSLKQAGLAKIVANQRFAEAAGQPPEENPATTSLAQKGQEAGQSAQQTTQAANTQQTLGSSAPSPSPLMAASSLAAGANTPNGAGEQMAPSALAQQQANGASGQSPFGFNQGFGQSGGSSTNSGFGQNSGQNTGQSGGSSTNSGFGRSAGQGSGNSSGITSQAPLTEGVAEAAGLSPAAGARSGALGQQAGLQDISTAGAASTPSSGPAELSPAIRQSILNHSVRLAATGGSAEVTVQTSASGPLGIKVAVGGGTVDVQLATADDELSQTLNDESPMLMDALRRQLPGQEIALRVTPPEEAQEFADQQSSRDSREFGSEDSRQSDAGTNQERLGNQAGGQGDRQNSSASQSRAAGQNPEQPQGADGSSGGAAETLATRYSSTGRDLAGLGAKGTLAQQLV